MRTAQVFLFSLIAVISLTMFSAHAAQALVPHRAVYDLTLEDASDRSDITGLSGRMVYEFNGSRCEGYTVTFRFVTRIDTNENSRLTDQQTTTYENPDGTEFSFATKSYVDEHLDREIRGTATLEDERTVVRLKKPAEDDVILDASLFPTRHMLDLIKKANAGETFYEARIFDGSDDANEVLSTTVVVGKRSDDAASTAEMKALGDLGTENYWPVSIAYFKIDGEGGEELPIYRIDFKLYENGVTRDLVMDYGEFSMTGELVDLAVSEPTPGCEDAN